MKQKSLLVICFLLFGILQTSTINAQSHNRFIDIKQESDSLFRLGMKLYEDSLYEEAIPYFIKSDSLEHVVRAGNDDYHVNYGLKWAARCYYRIGQEHQAKIISDDYIYEPINKFLLVKSDSILVLADRLEKQGKLEEALEKYFEASQIERSVLGEDNYWYANTLNYCAYLSSKLGKEDDVKKYIELSSFNKTIFDNNTSQKLISMIVVDEKYEDVDSILNWYESKPQKDDSFYFLNLVRFINGLNKVQKHQDVSMIVPYAKSGKRVFKYIVSEADFCNIGQTNYWPILISCAETFNYLNDSIICDIAKFSFHYYRDWNQRDLASLFKVTHNSYQYYCFNGLWTSATEIMECLYSSALEANDTTIIAPASASFIGTAYLKAKDYKNAEQWFSNSYTRFQAFTTKSSYRAYCELLLGMGSLYNQLYKNDVALQYATEACSLNLLNYGTHSKEYIDALALLSNCEIGIGKWDDGLKHLEEAVLLLEYTNNMSNREKQDYKDKLEFLYLRQNKKKNVTSSGNIVTENSIMLEATNDFVQGNFDGCISKFSYLLDLYESNIPNVDIGNFVYVAGSLSNAFISCGEYTRADSVSSKAISLFQESNLESPLIRSLYESKGLLYYTINNVDMALYWYNKAKDMYTSDDERSLQYGLLLSNLAVCQMTKEEYSLAKQLSDKAYEICVQFYGDNSNNANDRLLILNNLATIYTKLKDFSKGKELYERVIEDATSQHNIGAKALALINLSDIYLFYEHDFHKAEEYLREAMKMEAASYVKDIAEMDLLFAQILERRENAVNDIERYNNRIKEELASMYAHFSEVEREEYWTKKSQSLVFLNNLSAVTFNTPHTLKVAYDNAIYTKSMLINSGRLLGQLVNNCNLGIQNEYSSMINMKRRLSDKNCPNDSIDVYREVISQKEKAIVAATPNFSGKLMAQFKTCGAVQRMLSNNEIAIEFIFLPQIKTSFDESELLYGALVLTKNDTVPKLIPLCSEYDLKNLIDSYTPMGQNEIESLYAFSNKTLYHMIWEKLEPYIPKGSTVYYSPTGYISKINLSAISNGNKRLSEICSFHEVSTTASIDEVKQGIGIDYHYAALYGDINYYENVDLMAEKAKAYTLYTSGEVLATRSLNRGTWDLLPGTKEEVETIAELLRNKGTNVYMLTQNDANEESFKTFDANAPALIHIATHGFYFPLGEHVTTSFFSGLHSYTQKDYSMLYSGLLFAGGNNTWTGKKIVKDVEDGILTADEISRLDLSGNKLIVLSACNTGLGDIDNVDGVFGLQRGLKRAGVKTILMSLWKVPDEETKELMTAFYKELLSGQTPYQSLKTAQKQLMDAGKSPYYWAGFMLLD